MLQFLLQTNVVKTLLNDKQVYDKNHATNLFWDTQALSELSSITKDNMHQRVEQATRNRDGLCYYAFFLKKGNHITYKRGC